MTDDNLQTALRQCAAPKNMAEAAKSLLAALGYESKREIEEEYNATQFIKTFPANKNGTKSEQYLKEEAELLKIVFQYTEEELQNQLFAGQFDKSTHQSFLFVAIQLRGDDYARGDYACLTREISKRFVMPVVVLFFRAEYLTLSFAKRRINKTDAARDVLENVSLLREINCKDPHRGHVDILMELSLSKRLEWLGKNSKKKEFNFDDLLNAWLDELNTEALNKRFYKELRDWFDRAMQTAKFPRAKTEEEKNPHIIRLLSRMLFIWFIREKKLVEEKLFIKAQIMPLLTEAARDGGDNYYRAVLQNLFFATLNAKIDERKFREKDKKQNPKYPQHANYDSHRVFQQRRYENLLNNPAKLEEYLDKSPFVNGGLFDCLDPHKSRKDNRVDCFTDNEQDQKQLSVPDALFFDEGEETKGLFPILKKYKFTVEENTPIEQEVALDPELLGKVFENLLVYMKRKSTGSYYTPRVIVDYMLRESLLAHFRRVMDGTKEAALRNLLTEEIDYETTADKLNKAEIRQFINAAGELRLFDPAAGSGAFPMGALTKLTMALRRIDPKNEHLKEREEEAVDKLTDPNHKEDAQRRIKEDFSEKNQYNNYVRKLLLIRDTIFGADIQPIAVQICRLRFFISLAIEQKPNKIKKNNYGISPLPNLETKILAANTLIKLAPADLFRDAKDIKKLEREIKAIRDRFYSATDRGIKNDCQTKDGQKRKTLAKMLREKNYPSDDADKIAEWNLYAHDAEANWFSPEWMFGVENGFDIIIGNPPYNQVQRSEYPTAAFPYSQGQDKGKQNLYKLFVEQSHILAKNGGIATLIVPGSLLCDMSSTGTRRLLLDKAQLQHILEFPEISKDRKGQIFQSVVQGTCIYQFAKISPTGEPFKVSVGNNALTISNAEFTLISTAQIKSLYPKFQYIPLIRDGYIPIMEKVKRCSNPLLQHIATMSKGDFPLTANKNKFSITPTKVQLVRGRHIIPFCIKYDEMSEYFKAGFMEEKIKINTQYTHLISQQVAGTTNPKRLICALAPLPSHSVNVLYADTVNKMFLKNPIQSEFFLGLLNSKFMDWFFRITSTNNHVQIYQLKQLPIPQITGENKKATAQIEELAAQIITTKAKNPKAGTRQEESEIDALVYKLYTLTPTEITLIEGKPHQTP